MLLVFIACCAVGVALSFPVLRTLRALGLV